MAANKTGSRSQRAGEPQSKGKNLNAEDRRWLEKHGHQVSKSTLRAKWIHSPDEHQDRPGQTLATRDPEVIRAWAQERRAEPATTRTRELGGRPRTLRLDFPGYGGRSLDHIAWEDWLAAFRDRDLVFLYQEQLRDGRQSNFFRLDNPSREDA